MCGSCFVHRRDSLLCAVPVVRLWARRSGRRCSCRWLEAACEGDGLDRAIAAVVCMGVGGRTWGPAEDTNSSDRTPYQNQYAPLNQAHTTNTSNSHDKHAGRCTSTVLVRTVHCCVLTHYCTWYHGTHAHRIAIGSPAQDHRLQRAGPVQHQDRNSRDEHGTQPSSTASGSAISCITPPCT